MAKLVEITSGLEFPEGPAALDDGSVLVVEVARGTLTRVTPDGKHHIVARCGGGPNGAALGPDAKVYVCNSGGFAFHRIPMAALGVRRFAAGEIQIAGGPAQEYRSGSIQRVDLSTGRVEELYTECDGVRLCAPNDLVFDAHGGFWFTDHGHTRERVRDRTGVFYARADGSAIREAIFPVDGPNGIGLSPDGATLYVAETYTARLRSWPVPEPGTVPENSGILPFSGDVVYDPPGRLLWDSLAVEACGNVCLATLVEGGITVVSPHGDLVEWVPTPDPATTNLCFGGRDLRTAYITLSGLGRLAATEWPRPGLRLNYA
jgi:gluconolactonase